MERLFLDSLGITNYKNLRAISLSWKLSISSIFIYIPFLYTICTKLNIKHCNRSFLIFCNSAWPLTFIFHRIKLVMCSCHLCKIKFVIAKHHNSLKVKKCIRDTELYLNKIQYLYFCDEVLGTAFWTTVPHLCHIY